MYCHINYFWGILSDSNSGFHQLGMKSIGGEEYQSQQDVMPMDLNP